MNFLLPCEPFNIKKVDSDFKKEYNSISSLGFGVYLYDHDSFVSTGELVTDCQYAPISSLTILRSWMLRGDQYKNLYESLEKVGMRLINSPHQYLNCHYYPNVYKHISEFTPKSIWFSDISDESIIKERSKFDNVDLIIKDYVKSDSGLEGIFKLDSHLTNSQFCEKVHLFKDSRHGLFAEGIVLKEFASLKKYGLKTNEYRIFVLNHGIISICQNSNLGHGSEPHLLFLDSIIDKIDSNYFTIDIAELSDGRWIIIECGDGSVSGLSANQNELIYYMNFHNLHKNAI